MTLKAQQKPQKKYLNPDIIQGTHVKRTGPMRDFVAPPFDGVIVKGEKLGYHPKGDWILNDSINPNAKPSMEWTLRCNWIMHHLGVPTKSIESAVRRNGVYKCYILPIRI